MVQFKVAVLALISWKIIVDKIQSFVYNISIGVVGISFSKLCACFAEEEGRAMMVKRNLDGTVDKSLAD